METRVTHAALAAQAGTAVPASACFKIAMIWLSVYLDYFMESPAIGLRENTTSAANYFPGVLPRIKRTRQLMLELVYSLSDLSPLYDLLISVVGISIRSALAILAELAVLPSDMTGRQWVAHAGLDSRP